MVSRMAWSSHRIQAIEQVGDALNSGVGAAVLFTQRLQPLVQRHRNLLRDLRRKLPQLGHTFDGFGAQGFREPHQQRRGLLGIEMGQNEGDGLGMLAFKEFGQLLRVGFLQRVQLAGAHLGRVRNLLQQMPRRRLRQKP